MDQNGISLGDVQVSDGQSEREHHKSMSRLVAFEETPTDGEVEQTTHLKPNSLIDLFAWS